MSEKISDDEFWRDAQYWTRKLAERGPDTLYALAFAIGRMHEHAPSELFERRIAETIEWMRKGRASVVNPQSN